MAVDHAHCPRRRRLAHAAASSATAHGSAWELVSFPARNKGSALNEQKQIYRTGAVVVVVGFWMGGCGHGGGSLTSGMFDTFFILENCGDRSREFVPSVVPGQAS